MVTTLFKARSTRWTRSMAVLTAVFFALMQRPLSGEKLGTQAAPSAARQAPGAAPAAEVLVWSDEFDGGPKDTVPSTSNWVFETGDSGWGNHELEMYCAPGSDQRPCTAAEPNAYISSDGLLHLVARRTGGRYTSARMKTQGLHSFRYGRIEARVRIPGGLGLWPAFWMLGDDVTTGQPWPACGEIDIMESIAAREPGVVHGSLHGSGFPAAGLTGRDVPGGSTDSFHRYGVLWSPERISFYVVDPGRPYASFTAKDLPVGAVWPFDGRRFFILLNLAVGGDWPGPPAAATTLPAEMLVDYVRVWQRAAR